jgi:hypothetical protein
MVNFIQTPNPNGHSLTIGNIASTLQGIAMVESRSRRRSDAGA